MIGLLLAAGVAGAASAAPFEAVDATAEFFMLVDQATMARTGSVVEADILIVPAEGEILLARMSFDCTGRVYRQRSSRAVKEDFQLMPSVAAAGRANPAPTGTLGGSLLDRVCFNKKAKPTAGWTQPTLGQAITSARAVLARIAAKPG
ncbi:MAG: hypothetical protein Q8J89_16580 [Caulobacter sp.]|nr:hypothetical protein [Caulobacter sp.]